MSRIRFHLDENANPDIAAALRRRGIDVTTTQETGLRTAKDDPQWAYVLRERRVLVTHDADFIRRAAETPNHPGVCFSGLGRRAIGQIIDMLVLLYEVYAAEDMAGRIEYL
jgi:predicted nuclease of predicted toxin-antitoxin system